MPANSRWDLIRGLKGYNLNFWFHILELIGLSCGLGLQAGCVISGFCCKLGEHCALLVYYVASSGNYLPTFRDKLSVPSSGAGEGFYGGKLR